VSIIAAAGCGGTPPTPEELKQDRAAYLRELEPRVDAQRRSAERRGFREEEVRCRARVEPLLRAIRGLGSRLSVGLSYDEYTTRVGDVEVAYGDFQPDRPVQGKCLAVAVSAYDAIREYRTALDFWRDCIIKLYPYCEGNEDLLRKDWRDATASLDRAYRQLDAVGSQPIQLPRLSHGVPGSKEGNIYSAIKAYLCPRVKTDDERTACSDLAAVLQGGIQADDASDLNCALKKLADAKSPVA
jgi:hypothetical protein